ncbi:MAG: hypothetical protein EPN82_01065 [Bacteroidetes bacterium]|nr:MAG: hypothetical protein EPN82_01065 [Bacteroidota bacterium]
MCDNTSLNWTEIIISGLFGVFLGIIASYLTTYINEKIKRKRIEKSYSKIQGDDYICPTSEYPVNVADASINLIAKNKLKIIVKTYVDIGSNTILDDKHIWEGEIYMQTQKFGTLIWYYTYPQSKVGENGFKRIIIHEHFKGFTLIGEMDKGFGDQKFIRK